MKRLLLPLFLIITPAAVFAGQEPSATENQPKAEATLAQSRHYAIFASPGVSDPQALWLAGQMERRFFDYNEVLHFDPDSLESPLNVRVFARQEDYRNFVEPLAAGRDFDEKAAYLHFEDRQKRVLAVCLEPASPDSEYLSFQAFQQFLRAFVSNPPVWIRDGFATYFANLSYEPGKMYAPNQVWQDAVLDTQPLPSPDVIMRTLNPGETANFQAQACSLVWFMRDYGYDDYRRNLTDSFVLLSRDATLEENTEAVADRIETWNSPEKIAGRYGNYFAPYGTFSGCMLEGKAAYSNGLIPEARYAFMRAMSRRPKHYAPYYNLGLLAFEEGESGDADYYYRKAMNFGADEATVLYAMVLNAAADGRTYWALMLLQQAAALDPERFGEKARIMENRLRSTD